MAEQQPGMSFWNDMVLQPSLSPAEKQLRDRFVTEYLVDYNAWAACVRVGFIKSVAMTYASELMEDPYVRREISRRELERRVVTTDVDENAKARTHSQLESWLLREANYMGQGSSHSARIAAINTLAKIHKLLDGDNDTSAKDESLIKAFRDIAVKLPV